MSKYRAIVQYRFKEGMEEKGLRFLENELVKKADSYGCHGVEILHSEDDPSLIVGIALWNDIQDARRFQAKWAAKEHEMNHLCTSSPHRGFFKIVTTFSEKQRKAA
jgi:Antibiotic biosynthesis monooxygenase